MISRITTTGIIGFWLVMMGWLTWHDLWPAWSAQEPPRVPFTTLTEEDCRGTQVGLYNEHGERMGTAWTTFQRTPPVLLREDCLFLRRFPGLSRTRIDLDSTFDADGVLDSLEVTVHGRGVPLQLTGERFPREYAFELKIGAETARTFKIPLARAGSFGALFRPFASLPDLRVGQTWRMQILNPLAIISGMGDPFLPLLVRVTGRETLFRHGQPIDCFVVEAGGSRAWVGPDGKVYEQSVELPVGGRLVVRDEPFDAEALRRAKRIGFTKHSGSGKP